jgi:hypothetical protein
VRRLGRASKSKIYHIIHIKHRDEVEAPITEWLQEAYELSDVLESRAVKVRPESNTSRSPTGVPLDESLLPLIH